MTVCIAFKIPTQAIAPIRDAMRAYQDVLETSVPQEHWMCEIATLSHTTLTSEQLATLNQPIRQSFHPVINILSIGLGKSGNELWAYAQDQSFLHTIRKELLRRIEESRIGLSEDATQEFIPHIHIGNIQSETQPLSIPDTPVKTKFSLSELVIHQDYAVIETIPVTP
ncbi:MAG: hypothetical protein K8Q97_04290 [Candidatus Andersenbacteria bacterium]|nr:hypothetical protein [Candidatus Andersenbacteria bacterium]